LCRQHRWEKREQLDIVIVILCKLQFFKVVHMNSIEICLVWQCYDCPVTLRTCKPCVRAERETEMNVCIQTVL